MSSIPHALSHYVNFLNPEAKKYENQNLVGIWQVTNFFRGRFVPKFFFEVGIFNVSVY
jgi:hypothetical protein